MEVHRLLRISGWLRAAALAGAASAFLLVGPEQAHAADPLADAVDSRTEATEPVVDAVPPIVDALEPVTEPAIETAKPISDAVTPVTDALIETTEPVSDPVVDATRPIVDQIVGRVEPIVDRLPPVPVAPPSGPATTAMSVVDGRDTALHPKADAERATIPSLAAPSLASTNAPPVRDDATATGALPALELPALAPLTARSPGSGSSIPGTGDALLIGMVAAAFIGIAAGWHRLSLARLRLPSGLVLAPPVPPG